ALEQLARAGFRDGSDVGDNLIAAHTDAVVADHQRPGCGITLDPNLELLIRPDEIGPAQRLEPKPVERVRSVRNKFSKKYFFVRIERMNHQVEDLTSFRLKLKSAHVCCHGKKCNERVRAVQAGRPQQCDRPGIYGLSTKLMVGV